MRELRTDLDLFLLIVHQFCYLFAVIIWDIIDHKEVVQLEMNSDVRAVRLRRDRIVVVLDTSLHIFRLALCSFS